MHKQSLKLFAGFRLFTLKNRDRFYMGTVTTYVIKVLSIRIPDLSLAKLSLYLFERCWHRPGHVVEDPLLLLRGPVEDLGVLGKVNRLLENAMEGVGQGGRVLSEVGLVPTGNIV